MILSDEIKMMAARLRFTLGLLNICSTLTACSDAVLSERFLYCNAVLSLVWLIQLLYSEMLIDTSIYTVAKSVS